MDTLEKTESFARPYMIDCNSEPDITIQQNVKDIKEEYPNFSEEMCDYLASGKLFYHQLVKYDGIFLHSSAVVKDNYAYLFSAPCGTGKSTHTSLWRRVFGDDNVRILNDDKPALRLENGIWYAYGTPWSGKTGQNLNLRFPLRGICFLGRGAENKIWKMNAMESVRSVLSQSSKIIDKELKEKHLDLVVKLVEQVPIWKMECNMNPEAALISYEAMSGKEEQK